MLGVTVLPEWAQAEGVERVLDTLAAAGVTAVATSPYVMEPVADGTGSREPPADGGAGTVRLLDRALWGRRALWVRTAPSFAPNRALYAGLAYQPPEPDALTARGGPVVSAFIAAARARGMAVHLQVQAAIPPGYRVQFGGPREEDEPLGPDGAPAPGRVDLNASLAAPPVLAYARALAQDLAQAYPDADTVRIDWPETPPYDFRALFFDFSPHALHVAADLGIDVERMRRDALALRAFLTGALADRHLDAVVADPSPERWRALLEERLPGMGDLLMLRQHLSLGVVKAWREALPARIALMPQAFPPPFNILSGFDFTAAAGVVDAIGVKLYTMHWPMMLRNWGDALAASRADRARIAAALGALADTGGAADSLEALAYPKPDEPHPAGDAAMARKIATARQAAGAAEVTAFAHAYGPTEDVARRARIAFEASGGRRWVNRYGYLSDDKLAALARIVAGSVPS